MNKNLVFALIFLPLFSLAQTQQIYRGHSPLKYQNKSECKLTLTLNSQKQIIAVDTDGPSERWEIISDTGSGYGPQTSIVMNRGDEILSDTETFAKLGFKKTNKFFTDGYELKSNNKIEGLLRAVYHLDFSFKMGRLESFKKTTKFKASLVSLTTDKFECNELVKVAR